MVFHAYPLEDTIRATREVKRLLALEREAAQLLNEFMDGKKVCLALSFGKDSMTILHVLHQSGILCRCEMVMWNACGMETPDTLSMRDYVLSRYPLPQYVETEPDAATLARTLALIDLDAKHPTREFVYECLEKPRWRVMNDRDINGTILGIRQDESRARRMHVAMRGLEYWNKREKTAILMPIARWTTRDIFLYAAWRNVPLHPIYHRLSAIGYDREYVRLSSPVNLCERRNGQLVAMRRLYPQTYARYASMVPAVRDFS